MQDVSLLLAQLNSHLKELQNRDPAAEISIKRSAGSYYLDCRQNVTPDNVDEILKNRVARRQASLSKVQEGVEDLLLYIDQFEGELVGERVVVSVEDLPSGKQELRVEIRSPLIAFTG